MKKTSMRSLLILFVLLLCFSTPVNAAKIKLNKKSLTLTVGKTYKLKVKGTKKKVKWSSNNKTVASVNKKGKVSAKKAGKATITAKIGKKKYKCKVTVNAVKRENPTPAVVVDSFNETTATNSIIFLEKKIINGYVWAKVKNNYSKPAHLTFDCVLYRNGAVVGKDTQIMPSLNRGSVKWIGFFFGDKEFDSYNISVKAIKPWSSDLSNSLAVTASNTTGNEIYITVRNNSNKEIYLGASYVCVFYYNNDSLIAIEPFYTDNMAPGSTDILSGNLPYDYNTGNFLTFTSYIFDSYAFGD